MKVLLDTHLLLWSLYQPRKVTRQARALMARSEVFVSVASLWEMSIKSAIGKLKVNASEVLDVLEPTGFELMSIEAAHVLEAGQLPDLHQDPFDRVLVAQAKVENMTLLTNDEKLGEYGAVVRLL